MIKHLLIASGVLAALLVACTSEESAPESMGSADLGSTLPPQSGAPSPTVPPDPFITETGIRVGIIVDTEGGGSGLIMCEADAQVDVLNGKVVKLTKAPASFHVTPGEPVYSSSGGQAFGLPGVLLPQAVYRAPDGKLIAGWRHCDYVPEPTQP